MRHAEALSVCSMMEPLCSTESLPRWWSSDAKTSPSRNCQSDELECRRASPQVVDADYIAMRGPCWPAGSPALKRARMSGFRQVGTNDFQRNQTLGAPGLWPLLHRAHALRRWASRFRKVRPGPCRRQNGHGLSLRRLIFWTGPRRGSLESSCPERKRAARVRRTGRCIRFGQNGEGGVEPSRRI